MELFQKARIIGEQLVAENPTSRDHRMFRGADYMRIAVIQQALGNNRRGCGGISLCPIGQALRAPRTQGGVQIASRRLKNSKQHCAIE